MSADTNVAVAEHCEILIVGAGFSGLGAAIKLIEAGHNVTVVEKGDDVGGTWRVNTYPGCACDVPSLVYSFSFEPKPDWLSAYSPQPQILEYLQGVAKKYGVLPHIRFNTEVISGAWDDEQQRWIVETSAGTMTCDYLVAGGGPLSEPSIPDIPGRDSFQGPTMHSANWRHDVDLKGKRIAVVGTGASAIQFVPHVQKEAGKLTLFQRTPPWIMPRNDRKFTKREQLLNQSVPGVQRLRRSLIYGMLEARVVGFTNHRILLLAGQRIAKRHLDSQVKDPVLRKKLTPDYQMGCKRVLMSNTYYPALAADNADVVTDRIVEITPRGVVTAAADGTTKEHPVDVIIWGTGFHVTDPPVTEMFQGRGGVSLKVISEKTSFAAYRGLTFAGMPNFFTLLGPNTGLGHNSVVIMVEAQVRYLVNLLDQLRARGLAVVEPKQAVQDAYNNDLQAKLSNTVWATGGCKSWYQDDSGRITTLWPGSTLAFIRQNRKADLADYDVHPRRPRRTREAVAGATAGATA